MPEGPEIRRAADRLEAVLKDRVVERVWFAFGDLKPFESKLSGRQVTSVDTRGKAMLTRFEGTLLIYSHNQLYGKWYVVRRGEAPETGRQLRLALHTRDHSALLYSASEILVTAAGRLDEIPLIRRMGPDPLDPAIDCAVIRKWMGQPRFAGRRLAQLLLDQGFIAGIGNYLRSEVLFAARLAPMLRPADLSRNDRNRLASAAIRLPRRSYRTGGVTNPQALARRLEKQGLNYEAFRHAVFGRTGEPCHACGTPIEKTVVDSRRCYWCPRCQGAR